MWVKSIYSFNLFCLNTMLKGGNRDVYLKQTIYFT